MKTKSKKIFILGLFLSFVAIVYWINTTRGASVLFPYQGGTGTSTVATAGSVFFARTGGIFSQNNSNLFWDNTNLRLGIGTAVPSTMLHVSGGNTTFDGQFTVNATNPAAGTALVIGANKNINAASGDLTLLAGAGNNLVVDAGGQVLTFRAQTATLATISTDGLGISFGGAANSRQVSIDASGRMGIGIAAPVSLLQLAGLPSQGSTSSLFLLGSNSITGGNSSGTFLSANPTSTFNGDFINFQINSSTKFLVNSSGSLSIATGTPVANAFFTIASSSNILTVLSNGNVGVGITTPAVKFEVLGTVSSTNLLFGSATSSVNIALNYGTASTCLRLDANKNVVSATADCPSGAPTGANPTASLGLSAINGVSANFMRADAAPALAQTIIPTWTGLHAFNAGLTFTNATGTGNMNVATISVSTSTRPTNSLLVIATSSNILTVLSSGFVGIGTSTPNNWLYVKGEGAGYVQVGNLQQGGDYAGISLNGTPSAAGNFNLLSSPTDSTLFINVPAANVITFTQANTTTTFYIASNLNVGIGNNTSPFSPFHVTGLSAENATSSLVLFGPNFIIGGAVSGTLLAANPTSSYNGDFINFQSGSSTAFQVTSSSVRVGSSTRLEGEVLSLWRTTSSVFTVFSNSHINSSGTIPSVSICGTGPSVVGTDAWGTVSVGTGVVTACTLTFSSAYASAPVCVISDNSTAVTGDIDSVSVSAVTFGFSASLGGGKIYYHCYGND